jgi:hypothetical protein
MLLGSTALGWTAMAAPSATDSGLRAGGLAPPGAGQNETYTPPPPTEQELQRAEREDAGRGLEWFWLNGEFGFEHLGLETFRARQLVDKSAVSTAESGYLVGGGLGLRVLFLTLGPRFRFSSFADYSLWTLNAEAGAHVPLGALEPYAALGGGYASLGSVKHGSGLGTVDLAIRGFDLRVNAGLDYYLTPRFSVGGCLAGEILFLSRGTKIASPPSGPPSFYTGEGSGIGAAFTATLLAGLHF